MKVLNLIIKQKWFDEILAGRKTEEYREIRPTTFKKYCRYLVEGKEYEKLEDYKGDTPWDDLEYDVVPIKYDAIRLYVGYNKNRDTMLVEVKDCHEEYFVDDNDNPVTYWVEDVEYLAAQMVYELGNIIEVNGKPYETPQNA